MVDQPSDTASRPQSASIPRWRFFLDTIATGAMILAAAVLIYANWPKPKPPSGVPKDSIPLGGALTIGQPAAELGMIVYSDFQCPFCGTFARDILPSLERDFVASGKLLIAFRHFPLEGIHPDAMRAAQGAECAGQQGQFKAMHDSLFAAQGSLAGDSLITRAKDIGIDNADFRRCLDGTTEAKIRAEAKEAQALGVSSTPTFFIGRMDGHGRLQAENRISGAKPLNEFQQILNNLVKK